jgi:O-antigen/teichoic acid export membrane protein
MVSFGSLETGAEAGDGALRGAFWAFTGQVATVLAQGLYFVVLARVMGPTGMGTLSAAMALVYLLVPFALWGAGETMVRDVATEAASFGLAFGRGLSCWLAAAGILIPAAVGLLRLAVPELPPGSALVLAAAEIGGAGLVQLAFYGFQARNQVRRTGACQALLASAKAAAILLFAWLGMPASIPLWMGFYGIASWLAALTCLAWVLRTQGPPELVRPPASAWRTGFLFSMGTFTKGAHNDLDKVVLNRFNGAWDTGEYSVAFRALLVAYLPVTAVLHVAYRGFFQAGVRGIHGALAYARGLRGRAAAALGLALAMGALAVLALPWVLGARYGRASWILSALLPVLVFRLLHAVFADALTGAGFQGLRAGIQLGVAGLNLILCLLWIPRAGVRGAVWATLAADLVLVLATGAACWALRRRERRA